MGNYTIALARDDGLGVVVAVLFALNNQLLNALSVVLGEVNKLARSLVTLKELNGVVATLRGVNASRQKVLDVAQNILDGGVKLVGGNIALAGSSALSLVKQLVDAAILQSRDHHNRAAQALGELLGVDLVASLLYQVAHVECAHHRQASLDNLKRQVQVALEVGSVNNLNNHVRLAAHQIVARALLLGAIRGKRVDTREVGDGHALVL